jgi:hypothetical protein
MPCEVSHQSPTRHVLSSRQFQSPISAISDGTSSALTMLASIVTARAVPTTVPD